MGLRLRIIFFFSLIVFLSSCQTKPKEARASETNTLVSVDQLLVLPILNDENWAQGGEEGEAHGADRLTSSLKDRDWVVITLSSFCPCSQSHMAHLSELADHFPQFQFIGLHTDRVLKDFELKKFYQEHKLSFPVLDDRDLKISSALKAVTTPQVFVLAQGKQSLYQGAVTSASEFSPQNKLYLQEAIEARALGQSIRLRQTRSLGCPINYDWTGSRG